MAEVYLGFDETLQRRVAIKFVSRELATDATLSQRLLKEARAVADIEHPGVCHVFDAGSDEADRPYIVMEYVEGETLAERLSGGPLPPKTALGLCAEIAESLAAAHDRGIIHRDLKPLNVIVTPSGRAKVLDFGLAQFLPTSRFMGADVPTRTNLSARYAFAGTAAYMSPEQIQGKPLDGRSDLFALGAVLYECLTGRPTFSGGTVPEILGQVLHVTPAAPSSITPGVDWRHDELCGRLLAKAPSERFASAHEAAAALRSAHASEAGAPQLEPESKVDAGTSRPAWWRTRGAGIAALLGLAALTWGVWELWLRPSLPAPPADAQVWFQKGTDALREGAYYSAAKAFDEGIRLFPLSPTAYARLAEARAELDDQAGTHRALLQLSQQFPNESVLSTNDRLRIEAMRWLAQRNLDKGVDAYRRLVERNPKDADAWVDLGRAQEAAVQLEEAKGSFQRAIAIDPQFPAAYVHLGIVESFEGHSEHALTAFGEAERLYRTASNTEGQTEVLIRKGALFDAQGDYDKARPVLESAIRSAQAIQSHQHIVRAQMVLSSVTASEGGFAESERLSTAATDMALDSDLDVVAADGLVDLAATLQFADRAPDAARVLEKASRLAAKRGALRTLARIQTQTASLRLQQLDAVGSLQAVEPALTFFRERHYLKLELPALNIAARAHGRLDHANKAYELASKVLKIAETLRNDAQIADASNTLAGQAAAVGSLPEALALRTRAEAIHRRQRDLANLPYDLTNRAELLIQLGKLDEASAALGEVEDGIEKKIEGYAGRRTRVAVLRALAAIVAGNLAEAARLTQPIAADRTKTDSSSVLGRSMFEYAASKRGDSTPLGSLPEGVTLPPATGRERQYWIALTYQARGDIQRSLDAASEGLRSLTNLANDELRWRLAAVGSIAARVAANVEAERVMHAAAAESLSRIKTHWGEFATRYNSRPDLAELRKKAQLQE
jgi:tetratricopeptide (TPR) repeat protein/tRNA A-37 threonylcarbamoyl transferase component Bud32